MRTIKFRAWHKETKKMYPNSKLYLMPSKKHHERMGIYMIDSRGNGEDLREYHCLELMQFTGLTDKNGVEIYEGDIIEGIEEGIDNEGYPKDTILIPSKVIWEYDYLCWLQYITKENGGSIEVTGNIYENPELLEVT